MSLDTTSKAVEVVEEEPFPYKYYETQLVTHIHHFYLSEEIGDPSEYIQMIHKIRMAGPDEVIFIHLNTSGGVLATGVQIINAMEASQAHIIVSVEAESHSLGTLIFLAADEFVVHDNCMMMFHNFSGGVFGKGHEQKSQLEATIEWFETMARKKYIPFMSEEEFQSMVDGKDIWMQSEEIRERLTNMVNLIDSDVEEVKTKPTAKKRVAKRIAKRKS